MNGWSKVVVQAVAVVALLILFVIVWGLVTNPTSHDDILSKLDDLQRNQIVFCAHLDVVCE